MKDILVNGLKTFGIIADDEMINKFIKYEEILTEWNGKMNLTAVCEPIEIAKKHFIDSVSAASLIEKDASLIDVGSGAGFPGIPLKIVRNDISVVLLDALRKRVDFLNAVISELGLSGIEAIHMRAEDASRDKKYREKFSVATARAVAPLNVLCEYCMPFVKTGGKFIAYKGPDCADEIQNANNAAKVLGGKITDCMEVPFEDIRHTLVILDKTDKTLTKYPRRAGKPSKEPL